MNAVTVNADGFVVDAEVIGAAFGLEPASIPERLRGGEITSRSETGVDEDAGRWRLTFYRGGRALRLIVDAEGTVLNKVSFPIRTAGSAAQDAAG